MILPAPVWKNGYLVAELSQHPGDEHVGPVDSDHGFDLVFTNEARTVHLPADSVQALALVFDRH